MPIQAPISAPAPQKPAAPSTVLLTAKEAARVLNVSLSWMAKARMRGDGPAYVKVGRTIRYTGPGLNQYIKSRQRLSTSER